MHVQWNPRNAKSTGPLNLEFVFSHDVCDLKITLYHQAFC